MGDIGKNGKRKNDRKGVFSEGHDDPQDGGDDLGGSRAKKQRGPKVIPVLRDGLRRGRIRNQDLVELHHEITRLVRRSGLIPALGAYVGSLAQDTIRDCLWVHPPIVIPKVLRGKDIPKYVCVAGIEAFYLTKQIDLVGEVTVLRAPRRIDIPRMLEGARAELAMLQLRWSHRDDWQDVIQSNLDALDSTELWASEAPDSDDQSAHESGNEVGD